MAGAGAHREQNQDEREGAWEVVEVLEVEEEVWQVS
jgi:hypothetical protein